MSDRPLLMIPGPIEISDVVAEAAAVRPPSHLAPDFIEAFGSCLEAMRAVWLAGPASQPFVVAGSGTLAMESAVVNLVDPGDRVLVVNTGYFSDRMAEMLRRRGAAVAQVVAPPGRAPETAAVEQEILRAEERGERFAALFVTHVDTSTGVRADAKSLAPLAREHGLLSVFDGVCATAAERFQMADWGADVYLTASQKAIGLPPGLALWVVSERALAAREALDTPPPMSLDWHKWLPIMRAYEERRGAYFATPATSLVLALHAGLGEILAGGATPREAMDHRFDQHARAAAAMRAAWSALGLSLVPKGEELASNALSAIRYPEGVDATLPARIKAHGVVVAGGLHPEMKSEYFRVGHMGVVVGQPERLLRTVRAVGDALREAGADVDVDAAQQAARSVLEA